MKMMTGMLSLRWGRLRVEGLLNLKPQDWKPNSQNLTRTAKAPSLKFAQATNVLSENPSSPRDLQMLMFASPLISERQA